MNPPWGNMEVRYRGAAVNPANYSVTLNDVNISAGKTPFVAGDELTIEFDMLYTGDSITIVYTPTENVLQRVTVT
jgi:hypothetical protein